MANWTQWIWLFDNKTLDLTCHYYNNVVQKKLVNLTDGLKYANYQILNQREKSSGLPSRRFNNKYFLNLDK